MEDHGSIPVKGCWEGLMVGLGEGLRKLGFALD